MRAPALPSDWLQADGLPPGVTAFMTTRAGGVSTGAYASMNLRPPGWRADAMDDAAAVAENRRRLNAALGSAQAVLLNQVHGVEVAVLTPALAATVPHADAAVSRDPHLACTVLTADCLPVLLASADGRTVGAAHAGWRGLAAGVIEATVDAMGGAAHAWLGACIGPKRFEVGGDVREAFAAAPPACFVANRPGHWLADLYGLARWRLARLGVAQVGGGHWCTHTDAARFYSYRRDGLTGRQAAVIVPAGA
ncbi:MAG: peptidoglycan editing factor PgeF [Proteobacteria bacterium]|nr:peptidoglycan editing factor PgeF [Pseudomonadota bacterium]